MSFAFARLFVAFARVSMAFERVFVAFELLSIAFETGCFFFKRQDAKDAKVRGVFSPRRHGECTK